MVLGKEVVPKKSVKGVKGEVDVAVGDSVDLGVGIGVGSGVGITDGIKFEIGDVFEPGFMVEYLMIIMM